MLKMVFYQKEPFKEISMFECWSCALGDAHPLLFLGVIVLAGYAGGRAAHALNLPRISGYIVVGMLLSSSVTGILSASIIEEKLSIVTDVALGVIALWGAFCVIMVLRRVSQVRFRREDDQSQFLDKVDENLQKAMD